jgi:hypothetical protein
MLVYGDAVRRQPAGEKLALLRERLLDISKAAPGLHRHAGLVAALIEAGELAQGLADAHDNAAAEAAMALVHALAACCALSWDSDFERSGTGCERELDRLDPLLPPEPIAVRQAEGYAFYALYPESYLEAARALAAPGWQVFGVRSIGTSLAGMVAAGLGAGLPRTLRPSGHPFARQVRADAAQIELGAAGHAVVDEGPGLSGSSMAAVAQWLLSAGVPHERLHFFTSHANGPGPKANAATLAVWQQARVHAASFERTILHARRPAHRLESWVAALVGPLQAPLQDISGGRWRGLQPRPAGPAPPVQAAHERRKLLAFADSGRWLVKFAGLGREGERKFARAQALAVAGFSPQPAGLCHGFIVERWREDLAPLPTPLAGDLRARLVERIADYLAFRAASFPAHEASGASLQQLCEMGRHNTEEALGPAPAAAWACWGQALGRLAPSIHRVESDSRMHAWEWLAGGDCILKTDAIDHHAGHDLVGCQDIAWDIAGAAIEFALSRREEERLVERIESLTGRPVQPELLQLMHACYAAFQLGCWQLAAELAGEDAAALRNKATAYEAPLRQALASAPAG